MPPTDKKAPKTVAGYARKMPQREPIQLAERGVAFDWFCRSLKQHVEYKPGPLPTPCWLWTHSENGNGYGKLYLPGGKGKYVLVHIATYKYWRGDVPKGHVVDHLCSNRKCFNPVHLEAVTGLVNTLRGQGPTAINARKTHCMRGHELPKAGADGKRRCNECRRVKAEISNPTLALPGIT